MGEFCFNFNVVKDFLTAIQNPEAIKLEENIWQVIMDRRLMYLILKNFQNLGDKRPKILRKMGKTQTIHKMRSQMALKHMERGLSSLIIRKMQIKLHWNAISYPIDLQKNLSVSIHSVGKAVRNSFTHCWWNCKTGKILYGEEFGNNKTIYIPILQPRNPPAKNLHLQQYKNSYAKSYS